MNTEKKVLTRWQHYLSFHVSWNLLFLTWFSTDKFYLQLELVKKRRKKRWIGYKRQIRTTHYTVISSIKISISIERERERGRLREVKIPKIASNWNVSICRAPLWNYSRRAGIPGIFDLHDLSTRTIRAICQRDGVVDLLARNRVGRGGATESLEGGAANTRSTRDARETWPVSSVTFVFGDKAANCFWDRQINAAGQAQLLRIVSLLKKMRPPRRTRFSQLRLA